jgi:hypothetical protein
LSWDGNGHRVGAHVDGPDARQRGPDLTDPAASALDRVDSLGVIDILVSFDSFDSFFDAFPPALADASYGEASVAFDAFGGDPFDAFG